MTRDEALAVASRAKEAVASDYPEVSQALCDLINPLMEDVVTIAEAYAALLGQTCEGCKFAEATSRGEDWRWCNHPYVDNVVPIMFRCAEWKVREATS